MADVFATFSWNALVALILESESLNARLSKKQLEQYIERVQSLPGDQQQAVYELLLSEKSTFQRISQRMRLALAEYKKRLERKKNEIIKQLFHDAEKEDNAESEQTIAGLLQNI